jgi:hypothetical protein
LQSSPRAGVRRPEVCGTSASRAAAAAHPPVPAHALQHTLGVARGTVPHAVAWPLQHTPEQPAPHSGCRVRRCARTPPPRKASQDLHDRPVPQQVGGKPPCAVYARAFAVQHPLTISSTRRPRTGARARVQKSSASTVTAVVLKLKTRQLTFKRRTLSVRA